MQDLDALNYLLHGDSFCLHSTDFIYFMDHSGKAIYYT